MGAVGLYSNYCLITQTISNIMINLGNTIQPAVGNLFTEKNQERNYQVLRQLTFAFFVVIASVGAGVFSLVTPFVTDIWLGRCLWTGNQRAGAVRGQLCAAGHGTAPFHCHGSVRYVP